MDFNVSSQAFPEDGFREPISKMSAAQKEELKQDTKKGAVGMGATGAAVIGAKYGTGARALAVASKNPEKVARIANEYKAAANGRRPLTLKGVYHSKFHHDTVKRKLNHGITHWEDAGGVKLQRKIRSNPNSKLIKLHPRYAEHKLLHDAVQVAPNSHKKLYRGVTMHPDQAAAKLKPGAQMDKGVESWTDNKQKAKTFADNRIKHRDKGNVRVVYKMPKNAKALNIQGQSNYNMSEWVADRPYQIHSVKRTKKGNYKVKVKQNEIQKAYDALVSKAEKHNVRDNSLLAGGTLAAGVATAHNRIAHEINQRPIRQVDRKIKALKNSYGATPDGRPDIDPRRVIRSETLKPRAVRAVDDRARSRQGRVARRAEAPAPRQRPLYNGPDHREAVKYHAKQSVRNKYRALNELNHKRKTLEHNPVMHGTNRSRLLYASTAVAVPSLWAGARGKVEKRDYKKRDVDVAMVGGIAGAGGYQAGSMALKPLDRKAEAKVAADPKLTSIANEHRRKSSLPGKAHAGDPRWRQYFKTYPKELPGAKLKRTLAVTHTGKTGVAATTAIGLTGAALAAEASRKQRVSKMSPDASELHVLGTGARKGRLRPMTRQKSKTANNG